MMAGGVCLIFSLLWYTDFKMTIQQIENEVMSLPPVERIRLAQRLLNSVDSNAIMINEQDKSNPLLSVAGIFSDGLGDLSERVNEIVSEEIAKNHVNKN